MDRPLESTPRLVIFDLDGVVYRGLQPVHGAAALTAALRAQGTILRFATNNDAASSATLSGERRPDRIARDPAEVAVLLGLTLS